MNGCIKRSVWFFTAVLTWLMLSITAHAASFDCTKATTAVEKLICTDAELSKFDEELNAAYKAALQDKTQADTIKQAQKKWLKERNTCADLACVESAYKTRLQELLSLPAQTISKQKPKPRFTVTEGKGWTVCESYVRFLNSLPESEPPPLCHLKLSPDLKEPDWEELDIHTHLQLTYALEKLTSPTRHNRPVDDFDHWKKVFEQQIRAGEAAPRLRRTHLALVEGLPVETILAYEPDRYSCDKDVQKRGYGWDGSRTSLFIWNEQDRKIEPYLSRMAFRLPHELLLFQGRPFLFWPWSDREDYRELHIEGHIGVNYVKTWEGQRYVHLPACKISYELPLKTVKGAIQ